MSNQIKFFYTFGPFKLDVTQRVLLRDDLPLSLTPKSIEILLALVENGTQIVEKDELMKRIWPDTFVEEANLTQHISLLRKTLGENPQAPQFIETVPKRGYRFIAKVQELIVEEHTQARMVIEETAGEPALEPSSFWWSRGLLPQVANALLYRWQQVRKAAPASLLAVGVISLAVLIWWRYPKMQPTTRPLDFVYLTGSKTSESGTLLGARFAPNDKRIVFAADGKESLHLWVIQYEQIGDSRSVQITDGPWRDESPVWSSDGERIAFVSNRGNQIGIWSVPSLGGTPTLLKTVQADPTPMKNGGPALKQWAQDGASIYYELGNDIFALNLATKESKQLTHFAAEKRLPREFCLAADEKSLAYVEERNGQFDLWLLPLTGGTPLQLTNDPAVERSLAWHPDNQRLIYSLIREDQLHLYTAYIDGRPPTPLSANDKRGYVADISADGSRILCFMQQDECDLTQVNVNSGEEHEVTVEIGMEFWPAISRDGTRIAFQTTQGIWNPRRGALLLRSLTPDSQPTRLAVNAFKAQWSPDGEQVAFLRTANRLNNLWTVKAIGGEEKQLTTGGVIFGGYTAGPAYNHFETTDYSWSPDGVSIAYCSKQNGAPNLWLVKADASSGKQISANLDPKQSCYSPIWSPDGHHIAYISGPTEQTAHDIPGWKLWITDLAKTEVIFQTENILRLLGWGSETEVVVGMVKNEGLNRALPTEIKLARLSLTGQIQPLQTLEAGYFANLYLSPDGRNLSCVRALENRDNIWILPMFGGQARKLTNNMDKKIYFSSHAWSFDGKAIYYGKQTRMVSLTMAEKFQ